LLKTIYTFQNNCEHIWSSRWMVLRIFLKIKYVWFIFNYACEISYYLGNFDINYINFRNVKKIDFFFPITKDCEGKYWVFNNILILEIKSKNWLIIDRHVSKLPRYYNNSKSSIQNQMAMLNIVSQCLDRRNPSIFLETST
jgi:hypothetical protein